MVPPLRGHNRLGESNNFSISSPLDLTAPCKAFNPSLSPLRLTLGGKELGSDGKIRTAQDLGGTAGL